MYIERHVSHKLQNLAKHFSILVLSGARQVGKSTLLNHLFGKKCRTVVFDPTVDVENVRRDPDLFLQNNPPPLILDEIQFAPELVSAIKRWVDNNPRPGQYFLSGSQQWAVIKSLAESLAGRAIFLELAPFSMGEIAGVSPKDSWLARWTNSGGDKTFLAPQKRRPVFERLWRGFYPKAQGLPGATLPMLFDSYIKTYIERDARSLADFADLPTFHRFYFLMGALTGQEINYSHLGRDIGITPQTAQRWLGLLQSTYQWFELPAFSMNIPKRVSGRAKGYFVDTGLAAFTQAISSPKAMASHPQVGALFETAVVNEVRKQAQLFPFVPKLFHWRSHAGAEVDLILERDGVFFPMEVKLKTHPTGADTSGLTAFRKTHPSLRIGKGAVLAPVETSYALSKNDIAIPWDALLPNKVKE
jgi:predicted AAA+ superfamily ATPase